MALPLAAGCAQAQAPAVPPVPSYPQLFTALEGFGQTGHFDTGNVNTTNTFGVRGGGFQVGARVNEHLLIALRGQESWTNVSLTDLSQTISVRSQSVGLRMLVEFAPFAWDTTASYAFDDNSTIAIPLIGTAQWQGREWAVDTALRAKLPVGFLLIEPALGARTNTLHDNGFATSGFFMVTVPPQARDTDTYRGELKIGAPVHLDRFGTLTPWASGEVSRTTNPHPPLGYLTDLTGMAGGHYVFNVPAAESPVPFPSQTWRTARGGFRLDVTPSFSVDALYVHSWNDLGSWNAYQLTAMVKF
jgi:hypothetical protein